MPNPVTVPQRRPSTPAEVQASAARYAARTGNGLGQTYSTELHPSMQANITNKFGIPLQQYDNPNSFHANLFRSQMGAATDNRFSTYASQYDKYKNGFIDCFHKKKSI